MRDKVCENENKLYNNQVRFKNGTKVHIYVIIVLYTIHKCVNICT